MSSPEVSSSTLVQAPAATVFSILADPRQHPRIDGSGTVRGTVSGPDRLTLGSQFGMSMKQGAPYKIKNTVVEYDEDRLIAWRHQGLHRWRYELSPAGDRATQVTETWDISRYPAPVRPVFRALFARRTQNAIEATLAKLRAAAETDAGGG